MRARSNMSDPMSLTMFLLPNCSEMVMDDMSPTYDQAMFPADGKGQKFNISYIKQGKTVNATVVSQCVAPALFSQRTSSPVTRPFPLLFD
jgi:hypothetical protein